MQDFSLRPIGTRHFSAVSAGRAARFPVHLACRCEVPSDVLRFPPSAHPRTTRLQIANAAAGHPRRRAGGSISRRRSTTQPTGPWLRIPPRSGSVLPRRQSHVRPGQPTAPEISQIYPCHASRETSAWAHRDAAAQLPARGPGREHPAREYDRRGGQAMVVRGAVSAAGR